jgi:chemotaxis protein methyltransferase CheR
LIERSRLYATDLSETVLTQAKAGVFPLALMREYTTNYQQAGGQGDFSDYYTANNDSAVLASALKQNVLFAQHNLVSDGSFNEFHFISCRNVMIYFNHALQERAHRLLFESLAPQGFMAFGRSETMRFTPHETAYDELDAKERIYRKKS